MQINVRWRIILIGILFIPLTFLSLRLEPVRWAIASTLNTSPSYQRYLADFPESGHSALAREAIAWRRAVEDQKAIAIQLYIQEYPRGRYRDDASALLVERQDREGIDLCDAVAHKRIEFKAGGAGIEAVRVSLRTTAAHPVSVLVAAGTYFHSDKDEAQNMLTVSETRFNINTHWQDFRVPAVCANRHKAIPLESVGFKQVTPCIPDSLRTLAGLLAHHDYPVRQAAVWIVTDDVDVTELLSLRRHNSTLDIYGTSVISYDDIGQAIALCDMASVDIASSRIWSDASTALNAVSKHAATDDRYASLQQWFATRLPVLLTNAMSSSNGFARAGAYKIIRDLELNNDNFIPYLIAGARGEAGPRPGWSEPSWRAVALQALSTHDRIDNESAFNAINALTVSGDNTERERSLFMLSALDDPRAIRSIMTLLRDSDYRWPGDKTSALTGIASHNAVDFIEPLLILLPAADLQLRGDLIRTLLSLQGSCDDALQRRVRTEVLHLVLPAATNDIQSNGVTVPTPSGDLEFFRGYRDHQYVGCAVETTATVPSGGTVRILTGIAPDGKVTDVLLLVAPASTFPWDECRVVRSIRSTTLHTISDDRWTFFPESKAVLAAIRTGLQAYDDNKNLIAR